MIWFRFFDGPREVAIVAAVLLFVAAATAFAAGKMGGTADAEPTPAPAAGAPPVQFASPSPPPVRTGAASVVLDPDGGCTRARTVTAQVTAANGLPGALVLIRAVERADGDVEMALATANIEAAQAVSMIRTQLLPAWGAHVIRNVGQTADGLFHVTVG